MLRPGGVLIACAIALTACATADNQPDGPPAVDADDQADADYDGAPDAMADAATDPDACVSSAELCNGINDDCDSGIDEDFATLGDPCSAGVGACLTSGSVVCDGPGTGVICDAVAGSPTAESCNNTDDDCDTFTDEGLGLGTGCDGADGDLCVEGTIACNGTGGTTCTDATGTSVESCNAADDDCDGVNDEGFGLGTLCDGPDTDLCNEGAIACNGSGGTVCTDSTANNIESCNAADDDCDGNTDEGLGLGTPCDGTDGDACTEGVLVCGGGGAVVCNDTTSTSVESCNGANDDCDGATDEGYPVGAGCSVGVGACLRNGQQICSTDGTTTVCNVSPGAPAPETCGDAIDQDCNGGDPTCPGNDVAGGAIDISSGGVFTVDLAASHDDDFNATLGCGQPGGRDVFYQFTLGAAEVVYADTFPSTYDSVIRIYDGACTVRTGTPRCDDDAGVCVGLQSQLAVQLNAGTYCLVVDQYSSAQTLGATTLTFVRGGRPGALLATGTSSVSGTTAGQVNRSTGSCQTNSTAGDVGYYFTACPATTPSIAANTCNASTAFDTVLYVQKGNGTGTIGTTCNDDDFACSVNTLRSTIPTTSLVAGPGLYWLVVDGYQALTGPYQITYTLTN